MAEEDEYEVKVRDKDSKDVETLVDETVVGKKSKAVEVEPIKAQETTEPQVKKRSKMPQVPTQKIFKTLTNKDMMMKTLHDDTMEPHVHLIILLALIFILAIIISLLGF